MMPTAHPDEFNAEELRNLSSAERRERFLAWKAQDRAANADVLTDQGHWHPIDDDMTLDGLIELPQALPGDTRTPPVWVKFRHAALKKVVVARGRYAHDGGTWVARLSPVEDGDLTCKVVPLAWAPMVAGERPWDGPTVREHVGDPW